MAALFILIILILLGIAGLISMHIARRSAAPFYPTPDDAIRNALREVGLKPGELFYDLGAGTGKTLLIAEKEFGARAIGFEISILPYLIAKINLLMHGSKAEIKFKNFFTQDIKDADVVFCFLAIRTMQKMEDQLKTRLKPGARIVIYAFPLPGMRPEKIIPVHGQWKMFIYRQANN